MKNRTAVERRSERELVVTRTVNGPARLVFEAWTKAELFRRSWVPKSYGLDLRWTFAWAGRTAWFSATEIRPWTFSAPTSRWSRIRAPFGRMRLDGRAA